ncbi:MAG: hypothetical protein U0Q15_01695 [Kineosporiaceae bacterium]
MTSTPDAADAGEVSLVPDAADPGEVSLVPDLAPVVVPAVAPEADLALVPDPTGPTDLASRLAAAFRTGTDLDLADAEVDAGLIAALLVRPPDHPVAAPGEGLESARVPALRLTRAHVVGALDLAFAEVTAPVVLTGCRFDAQPVLTGACTRSLTLDGCTLPGLAARLVQVRGDLRLTGCTVTGTTSLENAEISGSLNLSASRLQVPGGRALSAGGMTVGGGVVGRRGLVVDGEARLVGAKISGGVLLHGATLSRPGGTALCLDEITTNRVELSDGFTCTGQLLMRSATITGRLSFFRARLIGAAVNGSSAPGSVGNKQVRALRARGMTAGEMELRPAQVEGLVDLSQAHVGALRDSEATWPAHLRLDGFTYDHLLGADPAPSVAARCRWLAREQETYRPQPYEQLAEYYRRLGHDADARRVLLAKERRRRATRPVPQRLGGWLLDALVGYGYRSELAAIWLAVLVVVGSLVFSAHHPRVIDPEHTPHFSPVVYAIDLLIPIGAFGLRTAYDPVGWTAWVADALIAAGWILATALVAGVSRRVGRD